jgi:hypothetical protein
MAWLLLKKGCDYHLPKAFVGSLNVSEGASCEPGVVGPADFGGSVGDFG